MLDLAKHIVGSKKAEWKPERFEDQYEDALKELLKRKPSGQKIEAPATASRRKWSTSWMRYAVLSKQSARVASDESQRHERVTIARRRRRDDRARVPKKRASATGGLWL
jgi:DNA end-binding protein Ku